METSIEKRFGEIVKNNVLSKKHPKKPHVDLILLSKDKNICLFEVNNQTKECFVNIEHVWSIFSEGFSMNDKEIQVFLNEMMFIYFQYENYLCNMQMF